MGLNTISPIPLLKVIIFPTQLDSRQIRPVTASDSPRLGKSQLRHIFINNSLRSFARIFSLHVCSSSMLEYLQSKFGPGTWINIYVNTNCYFCASYSPRPTLPIPDNRLDFIPEMLCAGRRVYVFHGYPVFTRLVSCCYSLANTIKVIVSTYAPGLPRASEYVWISDSGTGYFG